MNFFYIHPDDLRWLGRWLRNNLLCIVAIICFLLMIRLLSSAPASLVAQSEIAEKPAYNERCELSPGSEPCELSDGNERGERMTADAQPERTTADVQFQAVAPEGWRLTATGWEDVSTWPALPRSLGEIVLSQEKNEPAWLQFTLAKVRGIPPLVFALLQLTAIAAIVNSAKSSEQPPRRPERRVKHVVRPPAYERRKQLRAMQPV